MYCKLAIWSGKSRQICYNITYKKCYFGAKLAEKYIGVQLKSSTSELRKNTNDEVIFE
jgi:hypothetical protein